MYIIGISAFYHDSAVALIKDGKIISAVQEERFTRKKHDASFPHNSLKYCLESAGIELADVENVVFYDKPLLKFERLLETYLAFSPRGFNSFRKAMPIWVKEKLFLATNVEKELKKYYSKFDIKRLLFSEHHLSHSSSAFFASPYEKAIVLTIDGVGEWATTSVAIGSGNRLEIKKELRFPHSLGLLYSAFTYYTGFKVNSGEYKLMGLAPYGDPRFTDVILEKLVTILDDGTFSLNQEYFSYCTGLKMTNRKFDQLFGRPARIPEESLEQFHMDIAASIQSVLEIILLKMTRSLREEYGIPNLCLAGGVALNCVANGKILREGHFDSIWVQPAAGDAGGALGAAYVGYHLYKGFSRTVNANDAMSGAYLGPEYSPIEVVEELRKCGAVFEQLSADEVSDVASTRLKEGDVIGWFQGRMEFGPRSLGNRSIIGDPRSPQMQKILNMKVKYRESFRPFAPAVLEERAAEWFDLGVKSPYMLIVADVVESKRISMTDDEHLLFGIEKLNVARSSIPAVTHVDYSARVQTVSKATNPKFHRLLSDFHEKSGCPIVINTSFNVRGEPIVLGPVDAFRCFMGTEMDTLVIGDCILYKHLQNKELSQVYKDQFYLD